MFEDKRVNSTSIINIYTPHSELKYLHVHIQFRGKEGTHNVRCVRY